MDENLSKLRREYLGTPLGDKTTNDSPIEQFKEWFNEIKSIESKDPNAFSLATCGKDLQPDLRLVLLKGIENGDFIFFTNYNSKKGIQIIENPKVSMNFYWPELHRQVRIQGSALKLSVEESKEYFYSRPQGSQISAIVSPQSEKIASREILEKSVKETLKNLSKNVPLEMPKQWGGFKISPEKIEFWQGRENRLHDRIQYTKNQENWLKTRLAP
ncbi:MAG: pyridoxamine 5'-phosphate oxidase [Sphingobacteriales bacterium]